MRDLKDSVALVTGAGSGIGRATALELARSGCDMVLNDLRAEALVEVERSIVSMGRRAVSIPADVSSRDQAEALCRRATEAFGRVDILVNNAGVGVTGRMEEMPLEDWEWIMGINVWAHIYTTRALLPQMLKRRQGHLVHVASGAGLLASGSLLAYSVTKFAVVGMAESLAAQLRSAGIGVTVVCPAHVRTGIVEAARYRGSEADVASNMSFGRKAIERGMDPEVVARKIVKAIRKNRFLLLTHPWFRFVVLLRVLFPQSAVRVNAWFTDRLSPRVASAVQPDVRQASA